MLTITHDDEDVRALADEVVQLRAGGVVAAADAAGQDPA
jgi:ABC-type sulfate/molybdate transport systems ATPase subunit